MDPIQFLDAHDIAYILHEHKPVFTCEEAAEHAGHIPGMACKNLFLKDSKKGKYFLVCMPAEKRMDLKKFRGLVGASKIRFGTEEELMDVLGLTKGSVSPFGLLNDSESVTNVFIDKELWVAKIVSFHPNRNDQTLEIRGEMFQKYFDVVTHSPKIIML